MRFFKESEQRTKIEWYFTDCDQFIKPNVFVSQNWDDVHPCDPCIGEQSSPIKWRDGSTPTTAGNITCNEIGTNRDWLEGVDIEEGLLNALLCGNTLEACSCASASVELGVFLRDLFACACASGKAVPPPVPLFACACASGTVSISFALDACSCASGSLTVALEGCSCAAGELSIDVPLPACSCAAGILVPNEQAVEGCSCAEGAADGVAALDACSCAAGFLVTSVLSACSCGEGLGKIAPDVDACACAAGFDEVDP